MSSDPKQPPAVTPPTHECAYCRRVRPEPEMKYRCIHHAAYYTEDRWYCRNLDDLNCERYDEMASE